MHLQLSIQCARTAVYDAADIKTEWHQHKHAQQCKFSHAKWGGDDKKPTPSLHFPPKPNHNCVQSCLYGIKTQIRRETAGKTMFFFLYIYMYAHSEAAGAVGFACALPGQDDKKARSKNSEDSWSNGMKNKKLGLLLEGMWPNIFLIGRALYLAVREAVKSCAVPIRRGAQLAGLLLMLQLWYMRLHWAFIRKLHHKPKHAHTHTHKCNTNSARWNYCSPIEMLHLPNRKRAEPPQKIPAKKKSFSVTNWRWQQSLEAFLSPFSSFTSWLWKTHQLEKKKNNNTKLKYSDVGRGTVCRTRNGSARL